MRFRLDPPDLDRDDPPLIATCDDCGEEFPMRADEAVGDTEPIRCERCWAKSKVSLDEVVWRGGLKAS